MSSVSAILRSDRWWIAFAVAMIVPRAYLARHLVMADALSYLDLATEAVRHGPRALINGYWSPAYPAILAVATGILRPSRDTEWLVVQIVNVLLFSVLLHAVRRFLDGARVASAGPEQGAIARSLLWALAVWLFVDELTVELVSPDVLVAVVTLWCAVHFRAAVNTTSSVRRAFALGTVCGVGYWCKTSMFPLGLLLIGIFAVVICGQSRALARIGAAVVGWVALVVPLMLLISGKVGRPTIGESGRLNFAWQAEVLPRFEGWADDVGARFGAPAHPPRLLTAAPRVVLFDGPIAGNAPVTYDPSYWYAGVTPRFDWWRVGATVAWNMGDLGRWLAHAPLVVIGMLGLVISIARGGRARLATPELALGIWGAAAIAMYAMVVVEPRYIVASVLVLSATLVVPIVRRLPRVPIALLVATAVVAIPVAGARGVWSVLWREWSAPRPSAWVIADELTRIGVRPGDAVAVMDELYDNGFARAADVRVVALISRASWISASTAERAVSEARLRRAGITAIVSPNTRERFPDADWRQGRIGGDRWYAVRRLP